MRSIAVWSVLAAGALVAGARAGAAPPPAAAPEAAAPVDFGREIRPLLSKNCFACHGQDEGKRTAGLRLDVREAAIAPRGTRGAALVPGAPERSAAFLRVTAREEARRMPPAQHGHRLSAAQVARLRRWIREGAAYTQHWSFEPPRETPLPPVRLASWPRSGLDRYVLARIEAAGLRPAPEADRYTLLRRVSLDLRGLPPAPAEVEEFARDIVPGAYERAVDRLLADPAFGERWARMWLDLARYADSAGYGSDPLRTIWRYRDWVIDAFNRDVPYDRFTLEQLAGDLLPDATPEQRMATAFHRNTMTNTEGGTDDEEFRVAAVKDRVDTTLQVWMGLTMGCAKCHSHKYDPVTQKEYYQLYAVFNQTADNDRPDEAPVVKVPAPELERELEEINGKIEGLKKQLASCAAPAAAQKLKELKDEIARLEKSRPPLPTLPVMEELPAEKRRETRLMVKGNFREPADRVDPAVPRAFHPLPPGAPVNRLGVARWLTDARNPLTARVAVNRFWAQLFGVGLVETEEDFGTQGELPTHPELLDYLAIAFTRGQYPGAGPPGTPAPAAPWSVKALLRELVTSATYRQSSRVTPQLLAKDTRNRLLARAPRYRLEAEMVRDQALAVGGLLSRKMHGPSVYPPQPPGLWQAAFNGQRTWATSAGEDRYRRGLYTFWRRTVPYPSMATFDAPSRELCTVRRSRTNTPLQAFVTLNDPVFVEAAQALARRLLQEGGPTPETRAAHGLRIALCRPPTWAQVQQLAALYRSEREHFRGRVEEARALATEPLGPAPAGTDVEELAAWTVVANVLLNLDGVLTRG